MARRLGWCSMDRNRTKTLNFAVLATYAVFSFCGSAFHQWSHHGALSPCSACHGSSEGSENRCDEVSDSPDRHLCGSHAGSESCCSKKPSRRTSSHVCCHGSPAMGSIGTRDIDSADGAIARAKAKPHVCEICSMLSLLSQSWGAMSSEVASDTHPTDLLFETSSHARGVAPWMARSRAPPCFSV